MAYIDLEKVFRWSLTTKFGDFDKHKDRQYRHLSPYIGIYRSDIYLFGVGYCLFVLGLRQMPVVR